MCRLICASVFRKPPEDRFSHAEDQLLVVNMYIPFVLTVSQKLRECMLFCCASFLTRELKNCDGAFCTQKFKYICDTEAFEDDSVSKFSYFASVKNLTQAGENYVLINKCKCRWYGSAGVECLTRDRGVADSSLTGVTVLCPCVRHIKPS